MSSQEKKRSCSLWNCIKIVLALVLVGFILSKTNLDELSAVFVRLNMIWLVTSLLLYFLLTFLKALQYHILFGRRTSYSRVVSIVVWQNALSNFVAAGAGVASYLALFKTEEGVKLGRSTLVFLLTKVGDLFSVWLVLFICSFFLWNQIPSLHSLTLILLVVIGAGLLFFDAALLFRRPFVSFSFWIFEKTRLARAPLVRKGMDAMDAFADLTPSVIFPMVGQAFALSLLYYLVTLGWMVASLRMFAAPVSDWSIIFVSCILQLLSVVPISIFGSLGVSEFTSLYFYEAFGVAPSVMSPILLAWRATFYLMNLAVLLYLPLYSLFHRHSPESL
jgi:uncharacterized membrane protein YbhN (UPF0104 family)